MIDWVALAWIASSLVTLVVAGIGVYDAVHDVRSMDGASNGKHTVARMHLRNQAGRLTIGIAWTALGIPALFDAITTPLSIGVAILIAGNIILGVNAALDLRARRTLLA